jgi:sigma-B regulation protein RsbU (phosphoserine phosphatase)
MTAPPLVLLASPSGASPDDLRAALAAAGFAVAGAELGPPPPDLAAASAVVVNVGDSPVPAAGFTRLVRAELGDRIVPVVWLAPTPDVLTVGLDAGADAGLVRPYEPAALVAQVRAAVRVRTQAEKLAGRADEARTLNDQLRKLHESREADRRLAVRVQLGGLPDRLPAVGPVRFAASSRRVWPSGLRGWFGVSRLDEDHVGFWVADPGSESLGGMLVGLAARQAAAGRELTDAGPRLVPPGEVLGRVNRALVGLELDPPPLVGFAYGLIDCRTAAVSLARAGAPPTVLLPAGGDARPWVGPGPFLGAFDAEFTDHEVRLEPGDRLVLASVGDLEGVAGLVEKHAGSPAQQLADAIQAALVARDAFTETTVLVVEVVG